LGGDEAKGGRGLSRESLARSRKIKLWIAQLARYLRLIVSELYARKEGGEGSKKKRGIISGGGRHWRFRRSRAS